MDKSIEDKVIYLIIEKIMIIIVYNHELLNNFAFI